MSLEIQLAENTAALKTVTELLAQFFANNHVKQPVAASAAPKKVETKAAPKAETPALAAPVAPATEAAPATDAPSYDTVKAELLKLIAAKGSDAGKAVLTAFGVANGKQLKEEQYHEVLRSIAAALKGE